MLKQIDAVALRKEIEALRHKINRYGMSADTHSKLGYVDYPDYVRGLIFNILEPKLLRLEAQLRELTGGDVL